MSKRKQKNRSHAQNLSPEVMAAVEEAPQVKTPEVETTTPEAPEAPEAKPTKPLADRGRGNPDAKKIKNPQPSLNLKAAVVQANGGVMEFKARQWHITLPEGREFNLTSVQLAAMTVGDLAKHCGIEVKLAA